MIKLTLRDGTPWYVNPDHIISIGCINGGTTVELTTDIETDAVRHVTETPEEVARKVLEWWFNMNWLKQGGGVYARAELERLTGLKEKPNSYWQLADGYRYRYETGTRVDGGTEPWSVMKCWP
jgi:Uncharacterized protein, possibly involved in motility